MNIKSGGELMDVDMLLLDAKVGHNDTGTTSTASLLRGYAKVRIVVCDSLDGSSNIDAAISSDSIFGIYNPNDKCNTDDCDYNSALGSEERSCIVNVCQLHSYARKKCLCLHPGPNDLGPIGKPYSAINKLEEKDHIATRVLDILLAKEHQKVTLYVGSKKEMKKLDDVFEDSRCKIRI
ncbi:hypothetical protein IGI04_002795 [Brassica rapa subsp. trilocularis]|uniref:Uncharacterized protein n=1 Tax=Brassica rapa subsp. trilocularis TaxID=1813537 RepID=A0ABQ7NWL5_BRACM|nr:hypothetical protein IGI04_002795 [Brassica rapa subsp. trilocularis]